MGQEAPAGQNRLAIAGYIRILFAMARIRVEIDRNEILEAIRRAAEKLGRPPHRGELPRVAGISHSVVLKHFASLRDAVRAAGLEPSRRGLKVAAEDLLKDFARVAEELGRAPNRNEYVRHGEYAAGTFYAKFGSWPALREAYRNTYRGGAETRRKTGEGDRESMASGDRSTRTEDWRQINADQHRLDLEGECRGRSAQARVPVPHNSEDALGQAIHESDKAIALQWAGAMTALPGELKGKRRVTDAVCAMIVNTLIGAENDWQGQLSRYLGNSNQHSALSNQPQDGIGKTEISKTGRVMAGVNGQGTAALARVNGGVTSGGVIDDERPVMGPPFYPCALSNAPANEMGVMILFGMLAGELGFQIEAVQGRYPDIEAKRQIQPGKWQRVRIEAEYESRNFAQHGHDPEECDIIVCWRHNWVKCPKHIEVIELSGIVDRVIGPSGDRA